MSKFPPAQAKNATAFKQKRALKKNAGAQKPRERKRRKKGFDGELFEKIAKQSKLKPDVSRSSSTSELAKIVNHSKLLDSKSESFSKIRANLRITQAEMSRLSGISVRKISDLETGKANPSREDRRRYQELSRLFKNLTGIIKQDSIASWLLDPNEYFDGSSPAELIERGEADRVWRLIWRLQDGVPID